MIVVVIVIVAVVIIIVIIIYILIVQLNSTRKPRVTEQRVRTVQNRYFSVSLSKNGGGV